MLTNYDVAVHWLGNHYILCNNIIYVDNDLLADIIIDDDNYYEIYQYYLSDCSGSDVEALLKFFPDLIFAYSDELDLYVLCVDHYGTSWDYVSTDTTLKTAERKLGEPK